MSRAKLEKRILRLHRVGTGTLKIGEALGIGTGTVQRVLMQQPHLFDVDVVCLSVKRRRPPVRSKRTTMEATFGIERRSTRGADKSDKEETVKNAIHPGCHLLRYRRWSR